MLSTKEEPQKYVLGDQASGVSNVGGIKHWGIKRRAIEVGGSNVIELKVLYISHTIEYWALIFCSLFPNYFVLILVCKTVLVMKPS